MLFKILVFVEVVLFIMTSLLLVIFSVTVSKMKKQQFRRLLSFPGSKLKSLNEIKEHLLKTSLVVSGIRVNVITSSIIAIISLIGIWFLIYKKYISILTDTELILLGMAAIVPIPIVIALFEYCADKMIKRADELIKKGD